MPWENMEINSNLWEQMPFCSIMDAHQGGERLSFREFFEGVAINYA